jgi:hypothetical protein
LREKIRIAEAWLDAQLEAVRNVERDNARHVFSLSYSLMPTAGAMRDAVMAEAELEKRQMLRAGSDKEARDQHAKSHDTLLDLNDSVLAADSSWREWKITASERTSEKVRQGLMFGLEFTRNITEEGQRGFNSIPK